MGIKAPRLRDPVDTLSGGNQQKVALAKWLTIEPTLLIVDEPTRGVDVGAKAEIYDLIHRLVGKGLGCILISSEMHELLGMCNRIVVMRAGRIAGILSMLERDIDVLVVLPMDSDTSTLITCTPRRFARRMVDRCPKASVP
ncbi:MAG: ATP-binding cassette domain-containing protein [Phycisphaeraceae bacterium]